MIFGMGFGGLFVLILLLIVTSFRVLREYERGVVFMLGRFWKVTISKRIKTNKPPNPIPKIMVIPPRFR